MPDPALYDDLAQQLQQARTTRVPVRQLSKAYPQMTLAEAYRVQRA